VLDNHKRVAMYVAATVAAETRIFARAWSFVVPRDIRFRDAGVLEVFSEHSTQAKSSTFPVGEHCLAVALSKPAHVLLSIVVTVIKAGTADVRTNEDPKQFTRLIFHKLLQCRRSDIAAAVGTGTLRTIEGVASGVEEEHFFGEAIEDYHYRAVSHLDNSSRALQFQPCAICFDTATKSWLFDSLKAVLR
jgi:hypothetical protein